MMANMINIYKRTAALCNAEYVETPSGQLIGVVFDRGTGREYRLMVGDHVMVKGNADGTVCPGIPEPTPDGVIVGIHRGITDNFFAVRTAAGDTGLCKERNLCKC